MTDRQIEGQISLFDLDSAFGKMYPAHSVAMKEKTSKGYSRNSSKSRSQMPLMCLCLIGGGWTKSGFLYDEMGRWSIAWRIHDAQFWGVPQRRKRIALVADFNGLSAGRIMFDPQYRRETKSGESNGTKSDIGKECGQQIQSFCESMSRNSEQGEKERKRAACDAEENTNVASRLGMMVVCATTEMTPKTDENGVSFSLRSRDYKDPQIVCIEGNGSRPSHKGDGYIESETMYTLNSTEQRHIIANVRTSR